MKLALINASPKTTKSSSGTLLESVRYYVSGKAEICELGLHDNELPTDAMEILGGCEAWVLAFPLWG